jgi:hypothetical protein
VSTILFEVGLYFPKASLLAFYWDLIPVFYIAIRRGLYIVTVFVSAAALITASLDLFYCLPISSNWFVISKTPGVLLLKSYLRDSNPNACSVYNSWTSFGTNWALNITTDLAGKLGFIEGTNVC